MKTFTNNEAVKELRSEAKKLGLTFKRQNMTINNKAAYMFVSRETGERILEDCTLWSAYDNYQSGHLSDLAAKYI